MLVKLVDEKVIDLNVKVENSDDAIRKVGQLLVEAGKATESYVESMVEMSNSIKGYIVLAPGIAMPHARPECGVKEIGISLITLVKPIEFGNDANDPVRVVIGLAAKDSKTHLKLLQDLSTILDNEDIVEKFTNCSNKKEVMNIFKQYCN